MYTSFTDWDAQHLEHFGIRGMRWGERRYQNEDGSLTALGKERYGNGNVRSRLGIKHDLNKLDREQTWAKARYDYYNNRTTRKTARLERKKSRADSREQRKEIQSKIDKVHNTVGQKAEQYKALLERSRKMSDKIISNAIKKGYSIHSRDCMRSVNTGRNAAVSALSSIAGLGIGALTGVAVGVSYGQYAQGKHYRVKNDGLGTRTHRSTRVYARGGIEGRKKGR